MNLFYLKMKVKSEIFQKISAFHPRKLEVCDVDDAASKFVWAFRPSQLARGLNKLVVCKNAERFEQRIIDFDDVEYRILMMLLLTSKNYFYFSCAKRSKKWGTIFGTYTVGVRVEICSGRRRTNSSKFGFRKLRRGRSDWRTIDRWSNDGPNFRENNGGGRGCEQNDFATLKQKLERWAIPILPLIDQWLLAHQPWFNMRQCTKTSFGRPLVR